MAAFLPTSTSPERLPLEAFPVRPSQELRIGTFVRVDRDIGRVRFLGETRFAPNRYWVGVEFVEKVGKHNGTVDDITYFKCPSDHGIFVKPSRVKIISAREFNTTVHNLVGGNESRSPQNSMLASRPSESVSLQEAYKTATPPDDCVPFVAEGIVEHPAVNIGSIVRWRGVQCTVVHVGRTLFARGFWVGLDLRGEPYPPAPKEGAAGRGIVYRWNGGGRNHVELVFLKAPAVAQLEVIQRGPERMLEYQNGTMGSEYNADVSIAPRNSSPSLLSQPPSQPPSRAPREAFGASPSPAPGSTLGGESPGGAGSTGEASYLEVDGTGDNLYALDLDGDDDALLNDVGGDDDDLLGLSKGF